MRRLVVLFLLVAGMMVIPSTASAQVPPNVHVGEGYITTWGALATYEYGDAFTCVGLSWCGRYPATVYVHASSFWGVVKCAASVGFFVAGNVFLIGKARKAGGIYKVAKRIFKSHGRLKKIATIRDTFGYVLGIGAVVDAC